MSTTCIEHKHKSAGTSVLIHPQKASFGPLLKDEVDCPS